MKIFKNIIIASSTIFMMASCSKELEVKPTDSVPADQIFLTVDDIVKGVNGATARMSAYSNDMYVNALLSDEATLGAGNSGQGALTYRYQFNADGTTGGDVIGLWSSYYAGINHCNLILAEISKVTGDEVTKKDMKGQLLALRGIYHYQIMRAYCGNYNASAIGIPYVDYNNIFALPKRNTMGEVMARIENDFTEALTLLKPTPAATSADFDVYINRINLAGFMARIALYKGDYQAAVNYASTVISFSSSKRLAKTLTEYKNIWIDADRIANNYEKLFTVRYEQSAAIGSLWGTTSGDIYLAPSSKLNDVLTATPNDFRNIFIGTDGSGNRYVNKFFNSARGGATPGNKVVDMKVLRMAEIYLIRSEAYAKLATPDLVNARTNINALRIARGIDSLPSGLDQTTLVNAIVDERYKELCFEGFRHFDLRRYGKPVNRNAADANTEWRNLPAGSFRFVLPIPADELLANANMVQNPGY